MKIKQIVEKDISELSLEEQEKREKALYMRNWWAKLDPAKKLKEKERRAAQFKEWRHKVMAALGGQCVQCKFTDERALQIDHVHGSGQEDRRKRGFGSGYNWTFYRQILSEPDFKENYQLLCANCNWIKRSENKEHNTGVKERPARKWVN